MFLIKMFLIKISILIKAGRQRAMAGRQRAMAGRQRAMAGRQRVKGLDPVYPTKEQDIGDYFGVPEGNFR